MCKHQKSRKSAGFLERTVFGIVSLLKEAVTNDEIAGRAGFLQRFDPRAKLLTILLLLVSVLITKTVVVLVFFYLLCLIIAKISAMNVGHFMKRTLLFVPLFSLFIVVPALFNFVTPGHPVVTLRFSHYGLSITKEGIATASIFFMRVVDAVSLSTLLVLSTRHYVLLKVLRTFRVPQVFVMTMGMAYRYIYLLLDIAANALIAIKSRVGFISSSRTGRRIVAANMAGLWLKSYRLQSQVYGAMISRGYSGEPQVYETFLMRPVDFLPLTAAVAALIGTIWLNRFLH